MREKYPRTLLVFPLFVSNGVRVVKMKSMGRPTKKTFLCVGCGTTNPTRFGGSKSQCRSCTSRAYRQRLLLPENQEKLRIYREKRRLAAIQYRATITKEKRREYNAAYKTKHPDRVREHSRRYYHENRERVARLAREKYENNRGERARRWRELSDPRYERLRHFLKRKLGVTEGQMNDSTARTILYIRLHLLVDRGIMKIEDATRIINQFSKEPRETLLNLFSVLSQQRIHTRRAQ